MEMEVDGEANKKIEFGGGAGSVLNLAPDASISIRYHPSFGSHDDLLLLEVDDQLLSDVLHQRVSIRGQPDEDAVLCTPSATYAVKFVTTSNSVFLIPPRSEVLQQNANEENTSTGEGVASVIKVAPGSMELIQTAPKLDKLKPLLSKKPYRLDEDLENDPQWKLGLYTFDDLLDLVQASEEELRGGLKSLAAVELDGYWRIVEQRSMAEILNMILNNSILHDWSFNALAEDNVLSVLASDGFPRRIVLHCLNTYGTKLDSMEGCFWSLDEKRVCICLAVQVLGGERMKLETFMEKWMLRVPSGLCADLKMLEGEVLYEKTGFETWIRLFSVRSLPSNPAERFAALFTERPKWEWRDLEPYIRDLRAPGLSAEGLLLKYTRRSQPNANVEPIFSAR